MSASTIKKKWKKEAKSWEKNGDPAHDPELEIATEDKEIAEKNICREKILRRIDELTGKIWEELIGVNPAVLLGGGWTIGKVLEAIGKKHGEKVKEGFLEILAEFFKEKPSSILDKSGKFIKLKPNWRIIGPKIMKKLGKKLSGTVAGVGVVLALHTLAKVSLFAKEIFELYESLDILIFALRYETLRIDGETDPDEITFWYRPSGEIHKKIDGDTPCRIFLKVTYRWIDGKSGKTKTKELKESLVNEREFIDPATKKKSKAHAHTAPVQLPDNACFVEAYLVWTMHCPTDPPSVDEIFTATHPIRTSADCSKHRGKLPE